MSGERLEKEKKSSSFSAISSPLELGHEKGPEKSGNHQVNSRGNQTKPARLPTRLRFTKPDPTDLATTSTFAQQTAARCHSQPFFFNFFIFAGVDCTGCQVSGFQGSRNLHIFLFLTIA